MPVGSRCVLGPHFESGQDRDDILGILGLHRRIDVVEGRGVGEAPMKVKDRNDIETGARHHVALADSGLLHGSPVVRQTSSRASGGTSS